MTQLESIEITLHRFTSTDHLRPEIGLPYNQSGYTYATDGRIMIRVRESDVTGQLFAGNKGPSKACADFFPLGASKWPEVEFPPLWQFIPEETCECDVCGGSGFAPVDCEACEGDGGKYDDAVKMWSSCAHCNGAGEKQSTSGVKCHECEAGRMEVGTTVALNRGAIFTVLYYLKLIAALPNWKVRWRDPSATLYFTFDGGEGVLQLMRTGPPERAQFPEYERAYIIARQWGGIQIGRGRIRAMSKGTPQPVKNYRREVSGINKSCFFDINIKEMDRACERWLQANDPDWTDYKRRAQATVIEPKEETK
ncbi:MAG: hypothetical protein QM755_23830 [Luteolibacter sp.]